MNSSLYQDRKSKTFFIVSLTPNNVSFILLVTWMEINGLKLPVSFVEAIHNGNLRRKIGSWLLREEVDAYGNKLESELGEIYESEDALIQETNLLPKHFAPEYFVEPSEWQNEPGFIPDIIDFSKIVCFGMSGDGAPFCFDYRENLEEPSVIWWADAYWRRVAPDFDSFVALFDLDKDA